MPPAGFPRQLWSALRAWWQERSSQKGPAATGFNLVHEIWTFVLDSTPESRRRRYGDMEYDWEHRVNTTSGSVGWRERLLGVFHSPYQPTDAALFREMMATLPVDCGDFTFVDLGSGKGRTLLMASEYRFRKIVGVEIIPELHRAAQENIAAYRSTNQQCRQIESICADAREYLLPDGPLVLYLFNPLPSGGLDRVLTNLEESLRRSPRTVYVLYQNPLLGPEVAERAWLKALQSSEQFALFLYRPG